ncbi:hypothetical protein EJ08DRAFT_644657 [Tothia fuscella]|uniref:FHA domain-containing protein n=1 Tax=Tothia fuscella TaxID=1048955 RepID=A0A9P4U5M1_9PEZI|nr:hypothetical protein EJ08DRAFT_644657 [Tothia fuscella]
MWILSCDSDLFNGKQKYLKPSSRFLFGRPSKTGKEERETGSIPFCAIPNNKSISGKHLLIEIKEVKAGDGSNLHARSEVTVQDLGSKFGTVVDGVKVAKGEGVVLKGNEHVLHLGNWKDALRIKWYPIVLTLASLSKAEKANSDPLSKYRIRLEHLDIKFVQDYVVGQTTHVVAAKRNLPQVLQALVHGNYVTTDEFVDNVVLAAESENAEDNSLLEGDFDANLPDATKFVPLPSKEPNPRPAELFRPDKERSSVFAGYTFVFCMKAQYDNLSGAINGGSGKTLLYPDFEEGATPAADVVKYVKNAAGEKGLGEFEDGSEGKGVVVVRVSSKDTAWATSFMNEVDEKLNQRSIPLNEFLDPILMKDTSEIRKALVEDVEIHSSQTFVPSQVRQEYRRNSAVVLQAQDQPRRRSVNVPSSAPEPPPSTEPQTTSFQRRQRRPITMSRFTEFDDFDPSQIKPPAANTHTIIEEDEDMKDVEPTPQPTQNTRKRPEPPSEDEEDVVNALLPAAAAMKKRRLNGYAPTPAPQAAPSEEPTRKKKKEKEIDVATMARQRREKEEAEDEAEKDLIANADFDAIKDGVKVMELELKPRTDLPVSHLCDGAEHGAGREHWDDRWNGRKNFKKFRRKGTGPAVPIRTHAVIVPLVAVKEKDYGLGDQHWLDAASFAKQQKKKSQSQKHPQAEARELESQTMHVSGNDDVESQLRRKPIRKKKSQIVVEEEDSDVVLVEENSTSTVRDSVGRSTGSTTTIPDTQSQTQQATQASKGKKRLGGEIDMPPPAKKKKARVPVVKDDSSSDDEEDRLKFKFRRRG